MDKAEFSWIFWLMLGYVFIFLTVYYQDLSLFFVGMVVSVGGLFGQIWVARVQAQPFSFMKSPINSLYRAVTEVMQFKFGGQGRGKTTHYSDVTCDDCSKDEKWVGPPLAYSKHRSDAHNGLPWRSGIPVGPNFTVFKLEEPYQHPKFKRQDWLYIEHDGEFEDHVRHEGGEITYLNVAGVWHNDAPIVPLWETPRVHVVGYHIRPIYVFAKGPARDYDRWVKGEIAKESPAKMKVILESAILA